MNKPYLTAILGGCMWACGPAGDQGDGAMNNRMMAGVAMTTAPVAMGGSRYETDPAMGPVDLSSVLGGAEGMRGQADGPIAETAGLMNPPDDMSMVDSSSPSTGQGPLTMIGTWVVEDQIPMGANDVTLEDQTLITAERWDQLVIVFYDNESSYAVLQSGDNDPFNAGLFNRVDWIFDGENRAYICHLAQGLASVDAASALSAVAARADLGRGCQGFPWKSMVRIGL
ncbi:MAG: hypothetical protein VX589_10420 [Myxococcota bacterium]|nr:hypothetical protein [Myxococcota bacterium]